MSESCSPVSPVRIAVIQYDPQVGLEHCESNVSRGLALARRAAREGANLIVLPELANTGYTFNSRAEAYSHAQVLQDWAGAPLPLTRPTAGKSSPPHANAPTRWPPTSRTPPSPPRWPASTWPAMNGTTC